MNGPPEVSKALVLFGHGARDPQWAQPLERIRAAMLVRDPGRRVELAYLEYLAPSLEDCVARLVAAGYGELRILPVFIAQGGHLKNEVPLMVASLQERFPTVKIVLLPVMGEAESVIAAMAEFAGACLS